MNDVRPRSASKLPVLGKHKLPMSELTKPSKSKLKKTSMESGEMRSLIADRAFQPLPTDVSMNHDQKFDLNSPVDGDVPVHDFSSNAQLYFDKEFLPETEGFDGFEVVPHCYVPDVISGLDEFSSLPEYTDIG